MPSYVTREHRCTECGHITAEVHDRAEEREVVPCELCKCPAIKTMSAGSSPKISLLDGNGRFDSIRERRKVEKELKKASRQGRTDDVKKLRVELNKAGKTK